MAHGQPDPFREFLAQAMDELLKFAERSDRRWEAQERRWEEDRRLRAEEHATFVNAIERNTAALDKMAETIDESARTNVAALESVTKAIGGTSKITIKALGSVADALHEFSRELRRRRGPRPNGHR